MGEGLGESLGEGLGVNLFAKVWGDKWRIAICMGPVLVLVILAHKALLPLAIDLRDINSQLSILRENTYEKTWLDSTQVELRKDVDLLQEFKKTRESALVSDSSIQGTIDRIRGIAQVTGIEITKTTPILSRAEPLRLVKIKMDGFTHFQGIDHFFNTLNLKHHDLFLEEMLIRQGGDRSQGRLDCQLVLNVFDRKLSESP